KAPDRQRRGGGAPERSDPARSVIFVAAIGAPVRTPIAAITSVQEVDQLACEARIACGGEAAEAILRFLADVERVGEGHEVGLPDSLAAGEVLEQSIWVLDRAAPGRDLRADDRLDRLAEDLPVAVEVLRELRPVEVDLTETANDVVEREQGVAEGDADV